MTRAMRTAAVVAIVAALAAAAGCRKQGPQPRQAFETWLQAVEKCDSAAMRAGLTKQSIDQVEQLMKQLQAFVPENKRGHFDLLAELCKGYKKGAIQIQDVTVNGDQATLKLLSEGKPIEAPMSLEDGAWKLDFASLMKQSIAAAVSARKAASDVGEPAPAGEVVPPERPGVPSAPPVPANTPTPVVVPPPAPPAPAAAPDAATPPEPAPAPAPAP